MTGVFAALLLGAATVLLVLGWATARRDPLRDIAVEDLAVLTRRGRRRVSSDSKQRIGRPLGSFLQNLVGERGRDQVRTLIERSGQSGSTSVTDFFDDVGYYTVLLGGLAVMVFALGVSPWISLVLIAFGVLAPCYVLWASAAERQEEIDRDLPDFLDVLAVTVSAGLGFRAALMTVAGRFGGAISEEINTVLHQITNGASVRSAFTTMRDRTRSDAVNEFVTAYLQAEELGAPLADTLNQIAADMRRATAQRMRQQAAKIEPRISLVMTMVLIPGALVILVGGMVLAMGADQIGGILGG